MKIFLLIFICFFSTHLAFSQDDKDWTLDLKSSSLIPKYVGKVKEIKGKAIAEERELQVGSKIYPHDLIKTDEKSFIKLELIDETLITIGAKSEFQVEQWDYRTKNDRSALFNLTVGKMRAEIKSKSKEKDQLKFKSSLVALGIRGTKFLLNNIIVGKKEISQVALMEGKIHLESEALSEKLNLKPGDYIEVIKDETLNQAKQKNLSNEELKNYLAAELPEQTNLLPEPVFQEVESASLPLEKKDREEVLAAVPTQPEKEQKIETVKEKLKKLNEIHKKNLK